MFLTKTLERTDGDSVPTCTDLIIIKLSYNVLYFQWTKYHHKER